jgi:hypothetical protein
MSRYSRKIALTDAQPEFAEMSVILATLGSRPRLASVPGFCSNLTWREASVLSMSCHHFTNLSRMSDINESSDASPRNWTIASEYSRIVVALSIHVFVNKTSRMVVSRGYTHLRLRLGWTRQTTTMQRAILWPNDWLICDQVQN